MSEESEWPVQVGSQGIRHRLDQQTQIGKRVFSKTCLPAGRLERAHLNGLGQILSPIAIYKRPAARVRKAKEPQADLRVRLAIHQPRTSFLMDCKHLGRSQGRPSDQAGCNAITRVSLLGSQYFEPPFTCPRVNPNVGDASDLHEIQRQFAFQVCVPDSTLEVCFAQVTPARIDRKST